LWETEKAEAEHRARPEVRGAPLCVARENEPEQDAAAMHGAMRATDEKV
jgi:hypothetical protein